MSNVTQGSLVADLGLETGLPTQVLEPFFSTWTPFQSLSWKAEVHRTKLSFLDPLMLLSCVCVCSVAQLCPVLCDPMDCNPSGTSIHRISQARTWNVLPFPSPGDLLDPTQGSNPHLLSLLLWQVVSSPLSHLGNLMLLQIQTQVEWRLTAHHTCYRIQVMSSNVTSSSQVMETLPFR